MTIGRLITPTLKLVREVGEGGMGQVWAAENLALGSLVAVKMLAREYADEDKWIVRFKQEAQRAARVRNPHVATIFDHGMTAEGEPYIVMELLEGETLSDRMKRNGALPLEEVETLIGQTAKALAAAHKLGVVHRDIKPANLFIVDNAGEPFVKVLDFGIAKQMDVPPDLTTTNTGLARRRT
jgi:eukaryotic-like serine/threonine-protein kinase